jgi:hypothetical protein
LQRSPHDLDVCLLADGIDAATIGGVSRFATALQAQLPHLTFGFSPSLGELPPARVYHALTPRPGPVPPCARPGARCS